MNNQLILRFLYVAKNISINKVNVRTKEIVVGLISNLASLELRRAEFKSGNISPEHPHSETRDDVELFISTHHEML